MMVNQESKELTANQLYKQYKDDGGTLVFSKWLDREKKKGIFPLNMNLNEEVYKAINGIDETSVTKKSSVSKPKSYNTIFIVLGIALGTFIIYKTYKTISNEK
jgi:hypothetical protein